MYVASGSFGAEVKSNCPGWMASAKIQSDVNFCPVCSKTSATQWTLVLRQINEEEAVYVCENPDCCYPVGYDIEFIKRPEPVLTDDQEKPDLFDIKELDTTARFNYVFELNKKQDFSLSENSDEDFNTVSVNLSLQPTHQQKQPSPVPQERFCENNSWNTTFDSFLDPEVAAYLDAAQ